MANFRARVDSGFESLARTLFRNRIKTLLLIAAGVAALLTQLPQLTSDNSNESFFHKDDPALGLPGVPRSIRKG